MKGFTGKLLRVNLSTQTFAIESSEKYHSYVGGKGMATRIIYDEVPLNIDPIAPESKIVMAVGPNTASSAPTSGRMTICFLSPFTKGNAICDAHMGGDTGMMMKCCGYDAVIIEGESAEPVYVYVNDDKVEFRSAAHLWGKGVEYTTAAINKETDKATNVVAIGPAGENLLNQSCVITGVAHCGGGGVGKIFGAKKLKAISFLGNKAVEIADPKKVMALNNYVMSDLIGSNNNHVVPTVMQSWSEYSNSGSRWTGHPGMTWGAAEGGPIDTGESAPGQPTLVGYRCQKAVKDHGAVAEKYTVKMTGCAMCPIRCYGGINVPQVVEKTGNKAASHHANTCLGNGGLQSIMNKSVDVNEEGDGRLADRIYCAWLKDDYGMWDNYGELNATLIYFMKDDYKLMKQILTPEEFAAIDWSKRDSGDISFVKDIMDCMCDPNHSLNSLAQGAYYVDQKYHDILGDDYLNCSAMALWGAGIGAKRHHGNECAAQVGLLTNIIHNRDGMCHTIVNITGSGLPYQIQRNIINGIFGEGALDAPKDYTKMNEAKAKFAKFGTIRQMMHDSMTLCNWVWPMTFSPRKERGYKGDLSVESQYMTAVTGEEWTEESLDWAVERVCQLHRAMTVMSFGTNDMRNEHDVASTFIFDEETAFTKGSDKLTAADWQDALTMYYKEFGWSENGCPTRETLEKFDLKDVADKLAEMNLLP